jgi:hypothetical protein
MKPKQHERFQKLFYENHYLLKIIDSSHQINFDVSGSTNNIYQVKLMKSFEWNNIYCNCPDSKKWANVHGVVCKHILFVIFKVLKLFKFNNSMSTITVESNANTFLEKRKLHKDFLEVIAIFVDLFNFNEETDFMKLEYVEKYHKIKESLDQIADKASNDLNLLEEKDTGVEHCLICFEDFDKESRLSREINSQCLICKTIFHKDCLTKWFSHNNTCPYCRSPSTHNTQHNTTESKYINLFGV